MISRFSYFAIIVFLLSGLAAGQRLAARHVEASIPITALGSNGLPSTASTPDLSSPTVLPRMAPDLALQVFHGRSVIQAQQLAGYSAVTVIHAELPQTAQQGEYELQRHYAAPHTLEFTALHYSGDGFVKSNVITRLLQSEVDHVKQDDTALTAITNANYKFSYRGSGPQNGRIVHVFQVKPRKKRVGLFKGKIFLDAYTGSLVRVEGSVVKSPSFFVRKIEFVQDYTDVGNFTFPAHIHSDAMARVIGRTIVDIYHRDYQPVTAPVQAAHNAPTVSAQ
jgi:hypothetical protein